MAIHELLQHVNNIIGCINEIMAWVIKSLGTKEIILTERVLAIKLSVKINPTMSVKNSYFCTVFKKDV